MNAKYLIVALHLLFLLVVYRNVCAQAGHSDLTEIQEVLNEEDQFSGVILLADHGKVIACSATGLADRENQIAMGKQTKFRIASITKSFTALLIMQLYEAGKLTLHQSVAEILPEVGWPECSKIEVRHLLNHTSGLPNEPDEVFTEKLTPTAIVKRIVEDKQAVATAGETFNYNNVDYLLLGLIVEKLYEKPWEAVVRDRILEPLEMKSTGFLEKERLPDGLARGYVCQPENCLPEPAYYIENYYAAGSMYATAEDLLKWDQGLYGGQLLSGAAMDLMYTSDPALGYAAFGSWTYHYPFAEGQPFTVERRGGILGFNSVIMRFPEAKKTLIILSNTDQFDPDTFGDAQNIKERLARLLFAGP